MYRDLLEEVKMRFRRGGRLRWRFVQVRSSKNERARGPILLRMRDRARYMPKEG